MKKLSNIRYFQQKQTLDTTKRRKGQEGSQLIMIVLNELWKTYTFLKKGVQKQRTKEEVQ